MLLQVRFFMSVSSGTEKKNSDFSLILKTFCFSLTMAILNKTNKNKALINQVKEY